MSKKYRSPGSVALDVIIYIVMIFVLLVCLVPFIYMLALSLSDPKAIINNQVSFWPVGWNLDAYEQIFTYPNFFRAYGNTIFYTVAGTAIALFMMGLFAYPLSKTYLRGQRFFMKMVIYFVLLMYHLSFPSCCCDILTQTKPFHLLRQPRFHGVLTLLVVFFAKRTRTNLPHGHHT